MNVNLGVNRENEHRMGVRTRRHTTRRGMQHDTLGECRVERGPEDTLRVARRVVRRSRGSSRDLAVYVSALLLATLPSPQTTIMAMTYDGGVVMGADSRTSTGSYVANRVSDKLTAVHDRIYCCRSGSAADTQAVSDIVRYYLDSHAMEIGHAPLVKTAAALFQEICYNNKERLMASIICAGEHQRKTGCTRENGAGCIVAARGRTKHADLLDCGRSPSPSFPAVEIVWLGWDEKNGGSVFALPLGGALVKQGECAGHGEHARSVSAQNRDEHDRCARVVASCLISLVRSRRAPFNCQTGPSVVRVRRTCTDSSMRTTSVA
jgi:hypothetical protein